MPQDWPRLSVIVPACNEVHTLEAALTTLLSEDYPDLEIVLVDDRSTDGTGALVDRIAARDRRVRVLHIDVLPAEWLGKVHALHCGTDAASGEWLLYTDADVHFRVGTLRRAIALVCKSKADHLALLPRFETSSYWHEVTVAAFGASFFQRLRPDAIEQRESEAYVGIGAFNLVRRAALAKSEGWKWLRMEVADDVGLGLLLHRARAKSLVRLAPHSLSVLWYPSLQAMFRGLEKNMYPVLSRFRPSLFFARVLGLTMLMVSPVLPIIVGDGETWTFCFLVLAYSGVPFFAFSCRKLGISTRAALALPIGYFILVAIIFRSSYVCLRQGGINWRGTFYSHAKLRSLQRVKV